MVQSPQEGDAMSKILDIVESNTRIVNATGISEASIVY